MIQHVKLDLDATGFGVIEVDGQPIQSGVSSVMLDSHAGHVTRVALDLHVHETTVEADAEVTVMMTDGARDALIRLGWTPPQEDA